MVPRRRMRLRGTTLGGRAILPTVLDLEPKGLEQPEPHLTDRRVRWNGDATRNVMVGMTLVGPSVGAPAPGAWMCIRENQAHEITSEFISKDPGRIVTLKSHHLLH
jgi:hypothetical protein